MELNYGNLDRLHRARLVGQYHARKGFDSIQAFADWYSQLNAEERAFINFYQSFGHAGALDPSDINYLPLGERLKINLEVPPNSIKALNDALSLAAAAVARSSPAPSFQISMRSLLPKSLTDGYVEVPGQGRYVGISKQTKETKKRA